MDSGRRRKHAKTSSVIRDFTIRRFLADELCRANVRPDFLRPALQRFLSGGELLVPLFSIFQFGQDEVGNRVLVCFGQRFDFRDGPFLEPVFEVLAWDG